MSSVTPAITVAGLILLSEQEAAEILHAQKQTMRAWRHRRKGPPFYKLNGRILYKREDLEMWIDGCRVVPGEQPLRKSRGRGRTAAGTRRGSR